MAEDGSEQLSVPQPEDTEEGKQLVTENTALESTGEEFKTDDVTGQAQPPADGVDEGVAAAGGPDGASEGVNDEQTIQDSQGDTEGVDANKATVNEEQTDAVTEDGTAKGEVESVATTGEPEEPISSEQAREHDATKEAAGDAIEETTVKEEGGEEGERSSPVPDSGTFQEGERPETPTVQVPEPLSREGSPKQEPEHLDAGTPEAEASPRAEDGMEDVEEEEEPLFSREELMEAYQAALAEREQLQNHNTQLQHKLAEYFKKKKSDDQRQEMDKNVTDQEQRYLKYMSNLEELRNQEEDERQSFYQQLEELKARKQERLELVKKEHDHFTDLKRTVASEAISSRTGKPLTPREVETYISNELKKEEEVKVVRLENIKLKNRLKKREQQLKAKEELAEGLHLIDFEQLKIENQTYNEKIEERNEELLKFRKKITSTVQVLTHVKEKLQFVQAENQVQKAALREVEAHVALKRDLLSRTKKARDSLRIDNQRLRQRCGLLGNEALLRDFEERKDEGEELRGKLDRLKQQHAELVLKSAGVKKKIEETRS